MSRTPRPYAPGTVYHVVSRTIRHVRWFGNAHVADGIVTILNQSIIRSDAQLLAWAIMPTHYHLILWQGTAPLSRLMRRLNQRIALLVQRFYGHEGYVFERRFRHLACRQATHLRNAIVYVHRNPVDAGICNDAASYRWSSHRSYFPSGAANVDLAVPEIITPLRLFATGDDASYESLCAGYDAYATYLDACKTALPHELPKPPTLEAGDRYWAKAFLDRPARTLNNSMYWRPDIADLAKAVIREYAPEFTIEQLVVRRGGRETSMLRHEIIRRAVRIGFRGVDIANYLHISTAAVAKVASAVVGRPHVRNAAVLELTAPSVTPF